MNTVLASLALACVVAMRERGAISPLDDPLIEQFRDEIEQYREALRELVG